MKYKQLISGAFLLWTCIACSGKKEQAATVAEALYDQARPQGRRDALFHSGR